jgi:hypothetical protein
VCGVNRNVQVPGKPGEKGGNSLEMLGYLGVAAKVCEQRSSFGALFGKLVKVDRYDSNILNAHDTSPNAIAFFDYRLAFISFLLLAMSDLPAIGTAESTIALSVAEGARFRTAVNISIGRYWCDSIDSMRA